MGNSNVMCVLQHPTPVQMQVIPCILDGRDLIVLAETVSVSIYFHPELLLYYVYFEYFLTENVPNFTCNMLSTCT